MQELTEITTGLKALAKELDVPIDRAVAALAPGRNRDDKRPQLSDLRESGSIEQDADVVLFVFREEYYLKNKEPKPGTEEYFKWQTEMDQVHGKAEVIIGKQRHGPTGTVQLAFEADITRFANLAERRQHLPDRSATDRERITQVLDISQMPHSADPDGHERRRHPDHSTSAPLAANWRTLATARAPAREMRARVVKADAYGIGIETRGAGAGEGRLRDLLRGASRARRSRARAVAAERRDLRAQRPPARHRPAPMSRIDCARCSARARRSTNGRASAAAQSQTLDGRASMSIPA